MCVFFLDRMCVLKFWLNLQCRYNFGMFVFVIEVMICDYLLVSYEYIGKYGCVLYVIGQVCIIYIDLFKGIFRL